MKKTATPCGVEIHPLHDFGTFLQKDHSDTQVLAVIKQLFYFTVNPSYFLYEETRSWNSSSMLVTVAALHSERKMEQRFN